MSTQMPDRLIAIQPKEPVEPNVDYDDFWRVPRQYPPKSFARAHNVMPALKLALEVITTEAGWQGRAATLAELILAEE